MLRRIRRWLAGDQPKPVEIAAVDEGALLEPPCAALAEGRADDAIRMLEPIARAHPQLAEAHRLLAEALRERGDSESARDSYTLALRQAPDSWRARYGLALMEAEHGRYDVARRELQLALAARAGDNAAVRNALGAACVECGDDADAVDHFRAAIALDPAAPAAYSNLGYLLFARLEGYAEGAELVQRALALGSADPKARLNHAMVLQLRGQVDRASAVYDELIAREPGFAQARLNRGLIRLARGDFAGGWLEYEARKQIAGFPEARGGAPEWDGSDLTGKRIAIYPEQGLGDEIMFASCVPDVLRRARHVILVCHPKLEVLFRRSFPRATVLADRDSPALEDVDWSVRIGSLPLFLRTSRADFPAHEGYLQPDGNRVRHWRERLSALPGTRKVGIAWRGGLPSTRRTVRSIPLEQWAEVLGVPDVDFVSLQHTDCAEEIGAATQAGGVQLHHWPDALADYDETAALVSALDLVVSVQTAVVHLCGAIGVPVRALISDAPEWRYGETGLVMAWYPSVELRRKVREEDWDAVLRRLADELAAY